MNSARSLAMLVGGLLLLALGLVLTMIRPATETTTAVIESSRIRADRNHPNTQTLRVRTDANRVVDFNVDSDDSRLRPGQRVDITYRGLNVRSLTFRSAGGEPQGTLNFATPSPLWIFGPCGIILLWLGIRQRRTVA